MGVAAASEGARKILEIVCLWDALERFESEDEAMKTIAE